MNTATLEPPPTSADFPAPQWDTLLGLIEERQVVPVIGRELIEIVDPDDGQEKLLIRWLPSKLAQKLGEVTPPPGSTIGNSGMSLNHYVAGYVREGGRARDISGAISLLLKENDFEPSETLKKLAKIKEFNLFITTTFDGIFQKALDEVRHAGGDATDVIVYRPNKVADLPASKEELSRTTLYHLLGRVSAIPRSFSVSADDLLEWMAALQSATFTPERLSKELESSLLLLLGLQCDDWLARFFIRMLKGRRLSERRDFGEILADKRCSHDGDLCDFLSAFSRDTLIFAKEGGARKFVDELYERYSSASPVSPQSITAPGHSPINAPIRFLPPEKEMPSNAVFISYSRDDLDFVKRLKAKLDASSVTSWFDMEELKSGDAFESKIQKNIQACSYFIPVMSKSTATREEAFFRREWNWASRRMEAMPRGALFVLPVVVDDAVNFEASRPPQEFLDSNFTEAPAGELPDDFVSRLTGLFESSSP